MGRFPARREQARLIAEIANRAASAFSAHAAQALDRCDNAEAPKRLLDAIGSLVPYAFAMSVVYRCEGAPDHVVDTFTDRDSRRAMQLYLEGTYILNPVYNACLAGLKAGVYRLRELAPDNYFSSERYRQFKVRRQDDEELGYLTYGWPAGMEEVVIVIELPHGDLGEISLYRRASSGGFSAADFAALQAIEPLVGAIYRRIWQFRPRRERAGDAASPLDHLLADFGRGRLSPRECEVAHLILKGHSGESIARNLGISIATVKTHRQNLYAKLGLATQQELFSLFIRSLQEKNALSL